MSNDFIHINGKLVTFDFIRRPVWIPGASAPSWDKFLVRDRSTDNQSNVDDAFCFTLLHNESKTTLKFVPFPSFNIANDPCGNWLEWIPYITTDERPEEIRILAIRAGYDDDPARNDSRIATKIDVSAWNTLISNSRKPSQYNQHQGYEPTEELSPQQNEMVRRICRKIGDEAYKIMRQIRSNQETSRPRGRPPYQPRGRSRSPSPKRSTTNANNQTGQTAGPQNLLQMLPNGAFTTLQNLTSATAPLYAQLLAAQQGNSANINPNMLAPP